jgi:2-keto-3-deoxy-L-rhamnonate aldolase RhmA
MEFARVSTFKRNLADAIPMIGTWVKTPSQIVVEVLSRSSLDVLCLDAEHAPFDRRDLDAAVLATRAGDMPVLVRVSSAAPHHILNALDIGATGIVAPHVSSRADAEALVRAAHYGRGGRGYAGSSRAAGYTARKMSEHLAASREATVVVAQIEDAEGAEAINEIVEVDGVDCLFIGRADLAVSLGVSSANDPIAIDAALRITEVCRSRGRAVGSFLSNLNEVPFWLEKGITLFLLESDHTFLLKGAEALRRGFR